MGEAKRRGTEEERIEKGIEKVKQEKLKELESLRMRPNGSFKSNAKAALVAAMLLGLGDSHRGFKR